MTNTQNTRSGTEPLPHVVSGPAFDLRTQAAALRRTTAGGTGAHHARTLLDQVDLRLVLLELRAGAQLHGLRPEHRSCVQTLAGHVQLQLPDAAFELPAGWLGVVDKAVAHELLALDDSTILLSLSLVPAQLQPRPSELDRLEQEHDAFGKLLDLIEVQLSRFHDAEQPDYELLQDAFVYMTSYPDRFHHPKEELAFALVAQRDPALRPKIEESNRQHRLIAHSGAQLLSKLEATLTDAILARESLERPAREYLALYREHMELDEWELFPRCRSLLCEDDWQPIHDAVAAHEDPLFGGLVEQKYRALHRQIMREADDASASH